MKYVLPAGGHLSQCRAVNGVSIDGGHLSQCKAVNGVSIDVSKFAVSADS